MMRHTQRLVLPLNVLTETQLETSRLCFNSSDVVAIPKRASVAKLARPSPSGYTGGVSFVKNQMGVLSQK
jgi:hypothetical protein